MVTNQEIPTANQEIQTSLATPQIQPQVSQTENFTPPTGWGSTIQNSYSEVKREDNPITSDHTEDSSLTRFVKIFLIAIALILLGVLIGVITSKFLSPNYSDKTSSITNIPITTNTPTSSFSAQLSATPTVAKTKQLLLEYRNNAAGPLSFDFNVFPDWVVATKSADKNNLNLTLQNNSLNFNLFYNSKDSRQKPELCLTTDDIAPKDLPYLKYNYSKDITVSNLNWKLVQDIKATQSAVYKVCEQNRNNQFLSLTSFGYLKITTPDTSKLTKTEESMVLDLLSGFKIFESSSSSAILK